MTQKMWTDERLDDLVASVAPLPTKVAELGGSVEHLRDATRVLRAELSVETHELHQELAAVQRQLVQLAWGLAMALVAALAAVVAAVVAAVL